jgi:hypothetical protein
MFRSLYNAVLIFAVEISVSICNDKNKTMKPFVNNRELFDYLIFLASKLREGKFNEKLVSPALPHISDLASNIPNHFPAHAVLKNTNRMAVLAAGMKQRSF